MIMILINEFDLQVGTLELIGSNLGIPRNEYELMEDYVDKVVDMLRIRDVVICNKWSNTSYQVEEEYVEELYE